MLVKDERAIPVPRHDQIKRGLLLEIIAEAGLITLQKEARQTQVCNNPPN